MSKGANVGLLLPSRTAYRQGSPQKLTAFQAYQARQGSHHVRGWSLMIGGFIGGMNANAAKFPDDRYTRLKTASKESSLRTQLTQVYPSVRRCVANNLPRLRTLLPFKRGNAR